MFSSSFSLSCYADVREPVPLTRSPLAGYQYYIIPVRFGAIGEMTPAAPNRDDVFENKKSPAPKQTAQSKSQNSVVVHAAQAK